MNSKSNIKLINNSKSTRTYLINGDFIKFHTVFSDGEMVEEYNMNTGEIESRKIKYSSQTGKEIWQTEIGESGLIIKDKDDNFLIKESTITNPIFIRKDSKKYFQFRIRNMPWESSNYIIDVDMKTDEIIIKTKNKKYYKRFNIQDMKRLNIPIDPNMISVEYLNNTLIISYLKPEQILIEENKIQIEINKIKQEIKENPNKKYDPGCQHQ